MAGPGQPTAAAGTPGRPPRQPRLRAASSRIRDHARKLPLAHDRELDDQRVPVAATVADGGPDGGDVPYPGDDQHSERDPGDLVEAPGGRARHLSAETVSDGLFNYGDRDADRRPPTGSVSLRPTYPDAECRSCTASRSGKCCEPLSRSNLGS